MSHLVCDFSFYRGWSIFCIFPFAVHRDLCSEGRDGQGRERCAGVRGWRRPWWAKLSWWVGRNTHLWSFMFRFRWVVRAMPSKHMVKRHFYQQINFHLFVIKVPPYVLISVTLKWYQSVSCDRLAWHCAISLQETSGKRRLQEASITSHRCLLQADAGVYRTLVSPSWTLTSDRQGARTFMQRIKRFV